MVVVVVVAVGALLRQCECTQQLRHQEKEEGGRSLSFNLPPVGPSIRPSVPLPTHRPTDPPFPALHTDFWGRPLWYYFGWFGWLWLLLLLLLLLSASAASAAAAAVVSAPLSPFFPPPPAKLPLVNAVLPTPSSTAASSSSGSFLLVDANHPPPTSLGRTLFHTTQPPFVCDVSVCVCLCVLCCQQLGWEDASQPTDSRPAPQSLGQDFSPVNTKTQRNRTDSARPLRPFI